MNQTKRDAEEFARQSFTMRGMAQWQRWGITIVAIGVLIAGLLYTTGYF